MKLTEFVFARLVEPDGAVRTVEYTADDHNGFNAVVTRKKDGRSEVSVHGKHGTSEHEFEVEHHGVAPNTHGVSTEYSGIQGTHTAEQFVAHIVGQEYRSEEV